MLKRVSAALFEAPAGVQTRIVCRSTANNGVNDARFEYDGRVLPRETVAGLPGCTFLVGPSIRRFQAVVVFDPDARAGARYDLFAIGSDGEEVALDEGVTKADSAPFIDFAIEGLALTARPTRGSSAEAPPGRGATTGPAPVRRAPPRPAGLPSEGRARSGAKAPKRQSTGMKSRGPKRPASAVERRAAPRRRRR
jgi:hypothetical protein